MLFSLLARLLLLQFPTILKMERNATGHVVRVDGTQAHMIESLSQMLNFR